MLTQQTSGYKNTFGKRNLPQADHTRSIIIVENDSDEREFLTHEIKALFGDAPVKSFARGVHILRYLSELGADEFYAEKKPLLILMDLHTPGFDCLWTLRQLRKSSYSSDIPVVIISNTSDRDEINQAYQSGANGFLQKPFSRYEFVQILHQNADRQNMT